jgi:cytidylate kinase
MERRDEQDRNRDIAPAVAAPDAIHFDNSYDGFDEAVEALMTVIREGLTKKGKEI